MIWIPGFQEVVMDLCVCYYFVSLLHYVTDFVTILNIHMYIDSCDSLLKIILSTSAVVVNERFRSNDTLS